MKFLKYKDKKIAYQIDGKGFPVVLLHGFCEDSSMWDEFIEDLVGQYQIIRIDNPGFGKTDVWERITVEEIASIVKYVLDELEIKKCILIGHSMGGYIALAFAEKYQHYLNGLGLFHSHPMADTAAKKLDRQKSIDFINRNGHAIYVKQLIPKFFAPNAAQVSSRLVDKLIVKASQYNVKGITAALETMKNRKEKTHVLKELDCPALFIIGGKDNLIPSKASIDQTHLPEIASIHILAEIGHMAMFEDRKTSVKIIKEFIEFCHS